MPFISEEIWQKVASLLNNSSKTIIHQPYPEFTETNNYPDTLLEISWLKDVITAIRNIRGEMNISPAKKIPLILNNGNQNDKKLVDQHKAALLILSKANDITWLEDTAPASATALVNNLEILIPMADIIDKDAELKRLNKELVKFNKELNAVSSKLDNSNFIEKAPKTVVEQEKTRLHDLKKSITTLQDQISQIENIEVS